MKKILFSCIGLTCALLLVTACNDNNNEKEDSAVLTYYQQDSLVTRSVDGSLLYRQIYTYDTSRFLSNPTLILLHTTMMLLATWSQHAKTTIVFITQRLLPELQ